jgi:UDP-N-acetylmuramoyl-tripeptide--D-alanyl-D-alanine ligase
MMELGDESHMEHEGIVELLKQHSWKDVILVGGDFETISHPYRYFPDSESASKWLRDKQLHDGLFLIKGSRSMKMERVLTAFENEK